MNVEKHATKRCASHPWCWSYPIISTACLVETHPAGPSALWHAVYSKFQGKWNTQLLSMPPIAGVVIQSFFWSNSLRRHKECQTFAAMPPFVVVLCLTVMTESKQIESGGRKQPGEARSGDDDCHLGRWEAAIGHGRQGRLCPGVRRRRDHQSSDCNLARTG